MGFNEEEVREVAMQCLVEIARLYYDVLADYIPTFNILTQKSVFQDEEKIGAQAIEFWTSVAEEEIERVR